MPQKRRQAPNSLPMKILSGSFKYHLTLVLGLPGLRVGLPGYLYFDHIYARRLEAGPGQVRINPKLAVARQRVVHHWLGAGLKVH